MPVSQARPSPGGARPRGEAANRRRAYQAAGKRSPDQRSVHEILAHGQFPARRKLGHPRRRPGSAGRAVDPQPGWMATAARAVTLGGGEHDVAAVADLRVVRVRELQLLVDRGPGTTGTRPSAASIAVVTIPARSASDRASYSPSDPFGIRPATPSSMSQAQCAPNCPMSTDPSSRNGVVVAAYTPAKRARARSSVTNAVLSLVSPDDKRAGLPGNWPPRTAPGPARRITVATWRTTRAGRVDSWIWSVRLVKTRLAASSACRAGHVRVNGALGSSPPTPSGPVTRCGSAKRDASASWSSSGLSASGPARRSRRSATSITARRRHRGRRWCRWPSANAAQAVRPSGSAAVSRSCWGDRPADQAVGPRHGSGGRGCTGPGGCGCTGLAAAAVPGRPGRVTLRRIHLLLGRDRPPCGAGPGGPPRAG